MVMSDEVKKHLERLRRQLRLLRKKKKTARKKTARKKTAKKKTAKKKRRGRTKKEEKEHNERKENERKCKEKERKRKEAARRIFGRCSTFPRKKQHTTLTQAVVVACKMTKAKKADILYGAYRCHDCNGFHTGNIDEKKWTQYKRALVPCLNCGGMHLIHISK